MVDSRIEQFKKMAQDDPGNELGHFSLGKAYLEAGGYQEAAASLERAIQINPKLSKAYSLLASAQLRLNHKDSAISTLTTGVHVANDRGDIMPKNEMLQQLKDLGAPVPELKTATAVSKAVGEGEVHCQRCGRVARKQPSPPFSNAQGMLIYEKICADCWREWIGMGTKVINELRLPLNDPKAQKLYDQHMMEFLNLK